jgi:hypothetical protein
MQSPQQAMARRAPLMTATFRGYKTIFFESPESLPLSPQGFLIEQEPGWVLNTHFHLQHQFQVVVHGGGSVGRDPVDTISVHYASPEAGYGPVVAGPDGLWYFTLRAVHDTGSWHLPLHRAKMRMGLKKRHAMAHVRVSSTAGAGLQQAAAQPIARLGIASPNKPARQPLIEPLIGPEPDALAAWMLRVPPSQRLVPPADESGVGRFYIVGRGALQIGEAQFGALSLLFVSADETGFAIQAAAQGAEVVAVQFPTGTLSV